MVPYELSIATLSNGLRLVSVERPQGKTFALALAYRAGTFDDPPRLPGIAHFCEHLAFRGANKELVERLGSHGVYVNGCTNFDYTIYVAQGHVDHLPLALEFVANIVRNEPCTDDEITMERRIVCRELSDDSETKREVAFSRQSRAALGDPNWNVSVKNLLAGAKRVTAESINEFRRAHLQLNDARLALVGPMDIEDVRRALEQHVPPASSEDSSLPNSAHPMLNMRKRVLISVDSFPYVWIYFTYIVPKTDCRTRIAAGILANLIGGGPHSMLFRQLRTDRQLAYSVHADDLPYRHCTGLYSSTTVSRWSVNQALDILLQCESRFLASGIDAADFENAKRRLERSFELDIDDPEHLATYLAYESLRTDQDSLVQPRDYLRALSDLTLAHLDEAAKELLSPANRLVYVGGRVGLLARFLIRRKLASGAFRKL